MVTYKTHTELFIEKAEILKVLGHPQRLCITKVLCEKSELIVSEMQDCLDESQPMVSQHLSKLKACRIIKARREGTNMYYSIYSEEVRQQVQQIIRDLFE